MWTVSNAITGTVYAEFSDEWDAQECALDLQSNGIPAVVGYVN